MVLPIVSVVRFCALRAQKRTTKGGKVPPGAVMILALPETHALRTLSRDGRLLFTTRIVRMAAYGALSVVLVLYLAEIGFTEPQIGLLLSLTLFGDVAISAMITSVTDRIGRRMMLM